LIARGEGRRRKRRQNQRARRGRWVRRVAEGVERVGVVGSWNWDKLPVSIVGG